jgi:hypothetical protein
LYVLFHILHGLVSFADDPKVDFGDVVIHPDDTAVYVGEISQFMYGEYADAWSMFFEHMVRAEILCLHKISPFTRCQI